MSRATSKETDLGEPGASTQPMASAPASTAADASSWSLIPQILIRVMPVSGVDHRFMFTQSVPFREIALVRRVP